MIFSRYSTDGTEAAEDRPLKRFSRQEYLLGSEQLDLPEWLGVPLRQIPPEYEYNHANFNTSAFPHSRKWYYNYMIVRERPGLRNLTIDEFIGQINLDRERMPKVRKYLIERRRRPALAAARLRLEKLVALPETPTEVWRKVEKLKIENLALLERVAALEQANQALLEHIEGLVSTAMFKETAKVFDTKDVGNTDLPKEASNEDWQI